MLALGLSIAGHYLIAAQESFAGQAGEVRVGDPQFKPGSTPMEKLHNGINGIGAKRVNLLLSPGTYNIYPGGSSTYVIPANITLKIDEGVVLAPVKGKSLDIRGEVKAGPYQIFGGEGTVLFSGQRLQTVYPQWWGALANGVDDDTIAFLSAVAAAQGNARLMLPKGKYRLFSAAPQNTTLTGNLWLEGEAGTEIILSKNFWTITSPQVAAPKLTGSLSRKATCLAIENAKGINPGDLVHISSEVEAETAWHSKKHDISLVQSIPDAKTLNLAYPVNFSYSAEEPGLKVTIYRPHRVTLRRLKIVSERGTISLDYLRGVSVDQCRLVGPGLSATAVSTGIRTIGCVDVVFKKMEIAYLTYGVIPCYTRNFLADGTFSRLCIHPYAPSLWCDNVTIKNLTGKDNVATMDSHPSFNVHYDKVNAHDTGISCLRSVGGSIRNSYFYCPLTKGVGYFQNLTLTDPNIYQEYDFIAEDVVWDTPNAEPYQLAFGPEYGRSAYFRNVKAKNIDVSPGDPNHIGRAMLEDCQFDLLRSRVSNTTVLSHQKGMDAELDASNHIYVIDIRKRALFRTNEKGLVKGKLFHLESGEPFTGTVRIKTFVNFFQGPSSARTFGTLKLITRPSQGGTGDAAALEQHYQFCHQIFYGSNIKFDLNPSFRAAAAVPSDQLPTLAVSNITQQGYDQTKKENDWWVQLDITLTPPKSGPRLDLWYELELDSPRQTS